MATFVTIFFLVVDGIQAAIFCYLDLLAVMVYTFELGSKRNPLLLKLLFSGIFITAKEKKLRQSPSAKGVGLRCIL